MPGFTGRTSFVGRQRELAALTACLAATQQGRGGVHSPRLPLSEAKGSPQVVLIGGEPGVGKTRLVLELAGRARAEGALALVGRAYESEGMPAYLPFVEALRDYVRTRALEDLRAQLGKGAADVALLAPEVRDRLPDLPSRPPLSLEQERYLLFEAVSDFLLNIARSSANGMLLVLDDLHWADKPTVLLLRHLARKLDGAPLLLAVTYRTVEVDRTHPLTDFLADVSREGRYERFLLTPLAREEAAGLIEGMAGAPAAPAVVDAICRQTDGNPFFVGEMVRHLLAEGRHLADPRAAVTEWGIPEGVRPVLRKRLSRLSPAANRMLQAGAVLGDGFCFEVLAATCGAADVGARPTAPLLDALEEAVGAGILREEGEGYSFSHALIRQAVYQELSLPRRRRLHLQAGEATERVHAGNLAPHVAALAMHYRLAGAGANRGQAIGFSFRAGEAAVAVFAYEEAARHWQAALALMEAHEGDAERERRAALLERLGTLVYVMGFDHYPEGIAHLERALKLYEELGQDERAARTHSRLGVVLTSNAATMDVPCALRHFRAAEAVLGRGPEAAPLGHLYAGLATAALFGAHMAEGLAASRRAMMIGERLGNGVLRANGATLHGVHLLAGGRLGEGLALTARAWEWADRLNQTFAGFLAAVWCGHGSFLLDDPHEARGWYEREAVQPRQSGATTRRQDLFSALASAYAQAGDLAEARRFLAEAGDASFDHHASTFAQPLIAFWAGDWERAAALWLQARERHRRAGSRWGLADFDCWLARVHQAQGDTVQAEALFQEALAVGVEGPLLPFEVKARARLALLYAETGCFAEALPHLARCRAILAAGEDWRGLAGHVALAEAATLALAGHLPSAETRFERAVAIFRRYALPWDEAEALYIWGRALLAAGRISAGGEKLAAALAMYQRHGAGSRWLDRVRNAAWDLRDAQQRRLPRPRGSAPRAPRSAFPQGLTEREVEVLRLLAAGRSNREIGEALVLSVRTVERHITNIYEKIGAHGKAARAAAAAYALTHGLTSPGERETT